MKKINKLVSLMLSAALCIGMAAPALAVEYDISLGNVSVTETESSGWLADTKEYGTSTDRDITVTGTTTTYNITVTGVAEDTVITLKDVNIDVKNQSKKAAMSITGANSDVIVELDGENTLTSGSRAGLELNQGASVTIQDENESEGSLKAISKSSNKSAGIGSAESGRAGDITITGGTVTVDGAAAGIGSGNKGTVGDITITGENTKVYATGRAAGIGSGQKGTAGNIKIENGSYVEANGGSYSAAIGGAESGGTAKDITITDSTVVARGMQNGAGIGAGEGAIDGKTGVVTKSTVGDITITNSDVTAVSGFYGGYERLYYYHGAGIGTTNNWYNPSYSEVGKITIDGNSVVTAKGSVGIGATGASIDCGEISIGNEVTLLALGRSSGIQTGSDGYGDAENILIGTFDPEVEESKGWSGSYRHYQTIYVKDRTTGEVLAEFSPYSFSDDSDEDYYYESFAINLPDGVVGHDIIIVDDEGYYVVLPDDTAVYHQNGEEPLELNNLEFKRVKPKYEFASEDSAKQLPDSVTDLLNGYKSGEVTVGNEVNVSHGKWVLNTSEQTQAEISDEGKLQGVVYTGTWGWDAYDYTIIVDPNGGILPDGSATELMGEFGESAPDKPEDPNRAGYTFDGWEYLDEDGNTVDPFADDYAPSKDGEKITMTAKWDGYGYTITVDPNEGTLPDGSATELTGKVGEPAPEKPEDPTRDGYTFDGWEYLDEDGNTVDPFAANYVPSKDGEKISMVAKWTEIPSSNTTPGTPTTPTPGGDTPTPTPGPVGPTVTPDGPVGPTVTPVTPAPTPTVIDDNDVPQAATPAETPADASEAEEPADESEAAEPSNAEPVEIIDEELPLSETPEESEQPAAADVPAVTDALAAADAAAAPAVTVIEENAVPLSDVPQTGEASTVLWLAMLLACGTALVYLNTGKRKENA